MRRPGSPPPPSAAERAFSDRRSGIYKGTDRRCATRVSSMETPRRPEERASSTPRVREYRPRWRVSHRDGRRRRPCKRRDFHRRRAARPPCAGPGRKCPERMPKSTKAHPKACRSTGRKRPRKRPCNFREARPGVPSTPDGRTSRPEPPRRNIPGREGTGRYTLSISPLRSTPSAGVCFRERRQRDALPNGYCRLFEAAVSYSGPSALWLAVQI